MIALKAAVAKAILTSLVGLQVVTFQGNATYYAPGVMEKVVENRIRWGQLPSSVLNSLNIVGFVALRDCDLIGSVVYIHWPDSSIEGPFIVADCADPKDYPKLDAIDFAVDVDWQTAKRHHLISPTPVQVEVWELKVSKLKDGKNDSRTEDLDRNRHMGNDELGELQGYSRSPAGDRSVSRTNLAPSRLFVNAVGKGRSLHYTPR